MPFWSEEITVELWFSEISKLKAYVDYKIYCKDKAFAQGNSCWFLIDTNTKRPVKTDVLKEKFEVCEELTLGEHQKFVLPEMAEKISDIEHKMNLSDLDFNNHVNNKSYINIAEMAAPYEYKKTHSLKQLNIRFKKETFLNDVLICSLYKTNNSDIYVHKLEKDGISVCEISTKWEKGRSSTSIVECDLAVKKENC